MFKKAIYFMIFACSISFLVSCSGEITTNTTEATTNTTDITTNTTDITINTTEATTNTTEEITTIATFELPDLTGQSKLEIVSTFDTLGLNYEFIYETNEDITEDKFVRYDGEIEVGDSVTPEELITIVIATDKLVLPDLTGMTQTEILTTLLGLGIFYTTEIVTDDTIVDQTFSSYGNDLLAGDLVESTDTIIVNIGFNSTKLPDLTGMIKEEIVDALSELNILYDFSYIVDDSYAEDIFASYSEYEIYDIYEEGTITVNLYKNTFTDNLTSLIISKYVDGGDGTNDQAIELFNATNETINLSDYHIAIFGGGSYEIEYRIDLEDVDLAPGETYVIANRSSNNAQLLMRADLMTYDLVFDGNDTIQLRYLNNTYIDTIYNLGNSNFIMDNEVFIRSEDVVSGNREYTYGEWVGFIPTYVEVLGSHPTIIPIEITFTQLSTGFEHPDGGMDYVTVAGIADGDTAYFTPGFLNDERVRFLGVDTPETYPVTEDWGSEGKVYTTTILNAAIEIYIQSDASLGFYDNYGRSLGLVWVNLGETGITINHYDLEGTVLRTEHLSGWILLNYQLVLNGYSYNYYSSDSDLVFDNRYLFRWFQDAEIYAQENGLGIHS